MIIITILRYNLFVLCDPINLGLVSTQDQRLYSQYIFENTSLLLLDFSLTVKAAPHECVIRTSQPKV